MVYTHILYDVSEHIATITINRPDKLNALNAGLLKEIQSAVTTGNMDDDVYGFILTGSGDKAFAAGADIAEFVNFNYEQAYDLSADGHAVMNSLENSAKPIVAAVKGFALGGGCELAMACHFRIAGKSARFGQPEINLGLVPGYGGTQRLVQLIGRTKALELLCSARMMGADEANDLGLINQLVDDEEVITASRSFLSGLFSKSPQAMAGIIDSVNACTDKHRDGFVTEIETFGKCFGSDDFKEGTSAFLEKRKAQFRK
ncbi:MAG: enoyl-CoA hydratase/isomerase family protein [Flavobacteriales bacterium]|nr:enoyl-CoA hydratase/isomerase family protein [Bacteroidota bacterium]MCB9241374.1 enoyl-CoA hydratase/isomerase family protein [Flavobacteriales bacterium]